jgi:hypothetical protein
MSTALPQKRGAGLLPKNLSDRISVTCGQPWKNLPVLADDKISMEVNFFVRSFAGRITVNAGFAM